MCAFPHLPYSYVLGLKSASKMVVPADQLND